MNEMTVRRYEVRVCDACMLLQGQECHTPSCIFFLHGMSEVKEVLNLMLLRPMADGKPVFTDEEALAEGIVDTQPASSQESGGQ